jgi:hypothetical protein
MRTTESSPGNEAGARERDRALERTLRDALALAVSKKVADQALRQARNKAHDAGRRDLRQEGRPPGWLRHAADLHLAPAADPETVRVISPKACTSAADHSAGQWDGSLHRFGNHTAVGWTREIRRQSAA